MWIGIESDEHEGAMNHNAADRKFWTQCLFSLLFAVVGGVFAMIVHERRRNPVSSATAQGE